jgi:hypothetical protein
MSDTFTIPMKVGSNRYGFALYRFSVSDTLMRPPGGSPITAK